MMIAINDFKAEMVRNGYTLKSLGAELGKSEKTMQSRVKTGDFTRDEIIKIVYLFKLTDPVRIFFPEFVTHDVTQ